MGWKEQCFAYCVAIMLASTAESTLSSSPRQATEASLSGSSSWRTRGISPPTAPAGSTRAWLEEEVAAAVAAAAAAEEATATEVAAQGLKKAEEMRTPLRSRFSSSSRCFFSCSMEARSSDSVSIRPTVNHHTTGRTFHHLHTVNIQPSLLHVMVTDSIRHQNLILVTKNIHDWSFALNILA